MTTALRALLEHIVDYAGLFPPAALDLDAAVQQYAAYRDSPDAWMLGRFVVGAARVSELSERVAAMRPSTPWPIGAVATNVEQAQTILARPDDAAILIRSLEVKTDSATLSAVAGSEIKGREIFIETPVDALLEERLDAIAGHGFRAKIRTGGVTPDAFPPSVDVVRFLRGCLERDLPFKATAGLHHPIRGAYRLTYADDAPTGLMFGFLNVFVAAVLMRDGLSDRDAVELLDDPDPASIVVTDDAIAWRGHRAALASITAARVRFATSFGSCSFREPVDELPFTLSRVGA